MTKIGIALLAANGILLAVNAVAFHKKHRRWQGYQELR